MCAWLLECVLVGLDWVLPMMQFIFLHVTCSCIFHVNVSFHFSISGCDVFLSFSLSRIDCTWHLSANPLQLETLLVLGLLLLILPFPLFMFGSMMGRPNRTSLRTFRNVAFIWSAILFCQTFLTLFTLQSFRLGTGNLFVRYPWGVPSCLYRSFTPIYMVSILLYLGLPWHFQVYVS